MRLGIIGRGPWGDVYAKTLRGMGIDHWQAGRDWPKHVMGSDGVIIASHPDSHCDIADELMERRFPIIVEKPICMNAVDAMHLLATASVFGSIAFAGHTRLYSPAWREFKSRALEEGVRSIYAVAGGSQRNHWWDWGPHLVAMCLDLGFDPAEATFVTTGADVPLHFDVNGGMAFGDVSTTPSPLEVLISEFVAAIQAGSMDFSGLELGVRVVEYLQAAAGHRAKGEKNDIESRQHPV